MKKTNSGRKELPDEEKKKSVIFYVKQKHISEAKRKIQPIVDELNKK